MNFDELRDRLHGWLERHYPQVERPEPGVTLGPDRLLNYYDHMEVAILELGLLDRYPEYLAMLRRRRAYLRRMAAGELTKEQFRSMSAF